MHRGERRLVRVKGLTNRRKERDGEGGLVRDRAGGVCINQTERGRQLLNTSFVLSLSPSSVNCPRHIVQWVTRVVRTRMLHSVNCLRDPFVSL